MSDCTTRNGCYLLDGHTGAHRTSHPRWSDPPVVAARPRDTLLDDMGRFILLTIPEKGWFNRKWTSTRRSLIDRWANLAADTEPPMPCVEDGSHSDDLSHAAEFHNRTGRHAEPGR